MRDSHASSPSSADVWVAGCLFVEMAHDGKPLFSFAETESDLLNAHCEFVGFKTSVDGVEISPGEDESRSHSQALRDLVPNLCDCAFDLLTRMLCCEWRDRISAREALLHPFFTKCSCETPAQPWCAASSCGYGIPSNCAASSCGYGIPSNFSDIFDDSISRYGAHASGFDAAQNRQVVYKSYVTTDDTFGQTADFSAELAVLVDEHRAKKRARAACTLPSKAVKRRRGNSARLVRCR